MEIPHPTKIIRIREVTPEIDSLTVENVLQEEPEPGQFMMLWNGRDEKPMAPYKVNERGISIFIKRVGPFTRGFRQMESGELLGLRGPYGRGFDLSFERPLIVGGGIGVSPLLYLSSAFQNKGISPEVVLGFNSIKDAICVEDFENLAHTSICTIDSSMGNKGNATENLPDLGGFDCIFTCGPEPMMAKIGEMAEAAGTKCQLLVERYCKCAIGLCGSCALGRYMICRDGPVFNWHELKETEFGKFKRDACGLKEHVD